MIQMKSLHKYFDRNVNKKNINNNNNKLANIPNEMKVNLPLTLWSHSASNLPGADLEQ